MPFALSRCPAQALTALNLAYGGLMALLTLLWAAGVRPGGLLALANDFVLLCFAPLLLLLPAALLSRAAAVRRSVALPGLVFALLFGPALLPRAPGRDPAPRLRVISWNVYGENNQFEQLLLTLQQQEADIILLQELSPAAAQRIEADAALGRRYPHQLLRSLRQGAVGWWGQGLLSRFPIVAEPPPELVSPALLSYPALHVQLEIEGQHLTLVNVHPVAPDVRLPLRYDSRSRDAQVAALAQTLALARGPLIVAGDLNITDRDPTLRRVRGNLHDAFGERGQGLGFTYPNPLHAGRYHAPWPLLRIDYIFSSTALPPQRAWVHCPPAGSDHCMVGAELAWRVTPP